MKEDNENKNQYEDMIHLQRPVSYTHIPMSIMNRAAQFSPFAALTGYEGAIKEAGRLTEHRVELDEAAKVLLDEKLFSIKEQLSTKQEIEFVFFKQDEKKHGGEYITFRGIVKKIDYYSRIVYMQEGLQIPIDDIVDIVGE
ncbi:MAG: hypothetical protein ACK5JH_09700 [Anaerocolumna sp.]